MQIHGPAHLHGPQPVNAPHRAPSTESAGPANQVGEVDQLDISHEADMISRANDVPDVRADRVAEIKAQIQAGAYETDDKLEAALDRLLDEIG